MTGKNTIAARLARQNNLIAIATCTSVNQRCGNSSIRCINCTYNSRWGICATLNVVVVGALTAVTPAVSRGHSVLLQSTSMSGRWNCSGSFVRKLKPIPGIVSDT